MWLVLQAALIIYYFSACVIWLREIATSGQAYKHRIFALCEHSQDTNCHGVGLFEKENIGDFTGKNVSCKNTNYQLIL